MLDRIPGHLARRFQQIAVALFQAEAEAVGCDLTSVQYAALAAIAAHSGMDQATLAGMVALDRATATGVIDRLQRKGLIAREVSGHDRRARALDITAAGRAMLAQIQPAVDATQTALLSGLDTQEAEQFVTLLTKVIDALNSRSRVPLTRRDAGGTKAQG